MVRSMDTAARHGMSHAATIRHRRLCIRTLLYTTHHGIPLTGMAHGRARRALHGIPRTTTTNHTHHDRSTRTQVHTQRQIATSHTRRSIHTLCTRTPRKQVELYTTLRVHHHTARRSQTTHAMATRVGTAHRTHLRSASLHRKPLPRRLGAQVEVHRQSMEQSRYPIYSRKHRRSTIYTFIH